MLHQLLILSLFQQQVYGFFPAQHYYYSSISSHRQRIYKNNNKNFLIRSSTSSLWSSSSSPSPSLNTFLVSSNIRRKAKTTTTTTLYESKLWDRLEIEEDDEPYWYLLNCVAGLEMDLLQQCRNVCSEFSSDDVVKFVVPTETKTRSHGANRMVTETKVKYQGYVFGKLRLCSHVYEAIQGLDLCRSWMGTVNHKGYRKLPPKPVALNDLEVENFGLEDLEEEEEEEILPPGEQNIIVDEEGADDDSNKKNKVDEEALKTFLGLKVEDMVKVTKPGKFYNEDAIVRRLKDGEILLRFYTYGSLFEEWMEPSDVRKLTEIEVLKGLSGPTQPVTQHDFDNGTTRGAGYDPVDGRSKMKSARNDIWSNIKGGSRGSRLRERRQDRIQRDQAGFNKRDYFKSNDERKREERNWEWYKENRRNNDSVVADEDWTYRPQTGGREVGDEEDEEGRNARWNRPPSQRQQRRERDGPSKRQQLPSNNDDWSAFVSPAESPSKSGKDDFFESLMSELSTAASPQTVEQGMAEENDFFASLMDEISTEDDTSTTSRGHTADNESADPSSLYVDDFFATFDTSSKKGKQNLNDEEDDFNEDDLFNSFDIDTDDNEQDNDDIFSSLGLDNDDDDANWKKSSTTSVDEDDFFASLDELVGNQLAGSDGVEEEDDEATGISVDDDDDFFASLEREVSSQLHDSSGSEEVEFAKADSNSKAKGKGKMREPSSNPPNSAASPADLSKLTVPKLKDMLRARGLKVSGKKAELIERLNS